MPGDEVRMLYAGAVNYADAAQLVLTHEASRGRDGLILPTHTLMGLAIELLFKAVYLHRGGDETRLRRPEIRHDLVALQRLASEQGFNSSLAQIPEIIDIIGNNYARHEYRYMRSNSTLRFVSGSAPVATIQAFVNEVALDVGLPLRPSP